MAAQGARALAYGLGSVLIGLTLTERGLSNAAVGVVLASLLAGSALVSVLIARHGDRVGRRHATGCCSSGWQSRAPSSR